MNETRQARTIHTGHVFRVEVLSWTDEHGRRIERDIVRHPGAVLIVPVLDDDRLVMIRNFRVAVGRALIEFPAGKLERGEAPERAAARELEGETGYHASTIRPLGAFYTSPGFTDELMHAFVAEGLTEIGQRLEAGEQIEVHIVSRIEALKMVDDGRIQDGKTIAALLMWDHQTCSRAVAAQGRERDRS